METSQLLFQPKVFILLFPNFQPSKDEWVFHYGSGWMKTVLRPIIPPQAKVPIRESNEESESSCEKRPNHFTTCAHS